MAIDTKKTTTTPSPTKATTPAPAVTTTPQKDADPWADYSTLAEVTKTRSGYPVLRSMSGQTVLISDLVQDEQTKAFIATLNNADGSELGKYVVPPTYAKKLAAALKARRPDQKGIRVRLGEQKRGIGLS